MSEGGRWTGQGTQRQGGCRDGGVTVGEWAPLPLLLRLARTEGTTWPPTGTPDAAFTFHMPRGGRHTVHVLWSISHTYIHNPHIHTR